MRPELKTYKRSARLGLVDEDTKALPDEAWVEKGEILPDKVWVEGSESLPNEAWVEEIQGLCSMRYS